MKHLKAAVIDSVKNFKIPMTSFERGDYVKAEFRNDDTGESEWVGIRVDSCDEQRQVVFGILDSEPVLDYGRKLKLGSEIAVSYSNIREHKQPKDFKMQ